MPLFYLRFVASIFTLQLIHLVWLTIDIVAPRLFDTPVIVHSTLLQFLLVFIDYLEIPTLITVSITYVYAFYRDHKLRHFLYLILLNTQWIHILWITDEFVVQIFTSPSTTLAIILAWIAILIDYLELPVIYDTLKRATTSKY